MDVILKQLRRQSKSELYDHSTQFKRCINVKFISGQKVKLHCWSKGNAVHKIYNKIIKWVTRKPKLI